MACFVGQEIEEESLHRAKIGESVVELTKAVDEKKSKEADGLLILRMKLARTPNPPTDIAADKNTNLKMSSMSASLDELVICLHEKKLPLDRKSRHHQSDCQHRFSSAEVREQTILVSGFKVLILVSKHRCTAVDYSSYRPVCEP